MAKPISIFDYDNYRPYLVDVLEAAKSRGLSYRSIAKRCGISSPNYLQQVARGQRNMSVATARKVARGLTLDLHESEFFLGLVRLEVEPLSSHETILNDLRHHALESKRYRVRDASIHGSWLHGVIFFLATTKGFQLSAKNCAARLSGLATKKDIQNSIHFLKKKGWLIPAGKRGVYKQAPVEFEVLDDVRRIDLQRSHLRYLDIAKHRLNDNLDEREYRGMTIAIPHAKMKTIKEKVRRFMRDLDHELDGASPLETVVRVQFCAFKVTREGTN